MRCVFLVQTQKVGNLCYFVVNYLFFWNFPCSPKSLSHERILINLVDFFKKAFVLVDKGAILRAVSQRLRHYHSLSVPPVQLGKHSFRKGLFLGRWICYHWDLFHSVRIRQEAPCWANTKLQLELPSTHCRVQHAQPSGGTVRIRFQATV